MTTIGRYQYEINEFNVIEVWDLENPNEDNKPFFRQPDYPNGRPWENRETAETWIVNVINEWLTPKIEVVE